MKLTPEDLYQRQISLSELGAHGQQKFRAAKVVIIGCGGLGSVAATYLAASGIGHLHLVDFDVVDASNLHRQVFYTPTDIGRNKALVLAKFIKSSNPFITLSIFGGLLDKENSVEHINQGDIILDCTDHLWTKYLINDTCVLHDKTLIYGSLYKFTGYVSTFNGLVNDRRTGNLRDIFPEFPTVHIPNCAEIGTLNTIVGIIGLQQANEVLKISSGLGNPLTNQLLIYNSLDNTQHKIQFQPKIDVTQIEKIFKTTTYTDAQAGQQNKVWLISSRELKNMQRDDRKVQIISVIEDISIALPFEVTARIPVSKFEELRQFIATEIDPEHPLILVCQQGISSYTATSKLKKLEPHLSVYSLINGIKNY